MQRYHRESNTEKHAHLPHDERPGAFAQPGIGIRRPSAEDGESERSDSEAEEVIIELEDVEVVNEQQDQELARQIEERRQANREKEQRVREMESRLQQVAQQPVVEAIPVQQEVDANETENLTQSRCFCKKRRCAFVSVVLFLVVLVAIAAGIGLGAQSDKSESNGTQGNDAITTEPLVMATEQPTTPPLLPTNEPSTSYWNQLGQGLVGEASDDNFGSSLALSANGTIVAAGAMINDGNGDRSGHVRVFEFDESNNRWNQLGKDIDGEAEDDWFGTSVALSANGAIVAAGADRNDGKGSFSGHVRVFEFDESNNRWNQLGQDIDGEAAGDQFGTSVALSADGTIVAAGAIWNDGNGYGSGHVRVFEFDKSTNRWNQLGQDIDGEAERDYFGTSVAFSADGTIVAAGATGNVRVLKFDDSNNQWKQLGHDIDGEAEDDYFGTSVALSANGTIVAAGARNNDGNGSSSGHVRVFEFDESNNHWNQLGQDIDGDAGGDYFGLSVALSADGTMVGSGGKGYARVLQYNNETNQWIQLGNDTVNQGKFDCTVALSADGSITAVGIRTDRGIVRLFRSES